MTILILLIKSVSDRRWLFPNLSSFCFFALEATACYYSTLLSGFPRCWSVLCLSASGFECVPNFSLSSHPVPVGDFFYIRVLSDIGSVVDCSQWWFGMRPILEGSWNCWDNWPLIKVGFKRILFFVWRYKRSSLKYVFIISFDLHQDHHFPQELRK